MHDYFTSISSMHKPKILHLSNVAGRLGGGISEVVHALMKFQQKERIKPDLWFLGTKSDESEIAIDNKIDLSLITSLNIKAFINPFFLFRQKKRVKKYCLIHQHGLFLPISLLSKSIDKKIKVIISPHGFLEPEKMLVSPFKKRLALRFFEKKNITNASGLMACSLKEARSLRKYGIAQPIAIVPNGVAPSFLRKKLASNINSSFKKKYNINEKSKVLLFLSRIHPFKGLDLFINSITAVADGFRASQWVFVIAGIDELNHEAELKQKVLENGLGDIVRFIGPQYGDDKLEALDSADCFILPSKGENFGIVVIEALARGVPVIATQSTPWNELTSLGCGWWVQRSIPSFISVLNELFVTDRTSLIQMGLNGTKLVDDKYTWPMISQQTVNFYSWVLSDFADELKQGFNLLEDFDQTQPQDHLLHSIDGY